ncbi:hypothetical protein [Polyangium sp. 6x1]|uniref:hypothetical protein n=1 Tax=Polyangium sp. 6x1 TaxID=3042689 RepID=UPI00248316B0|nr:hypothetical protein [Polyangium sp. 6x1]MDI1451822.1 hypothetical protein [Polyangium sp. 6x1]
MAALDPKLDAEWLAKLEANPADATLRESYFAALDAAGDARGELARLEARVAALDLGAPERASLKSRRNELRETIAPAWRDRFGFGTRPGCDRPLPWPEDTATRWLALYEFIEECRGVWLPESEKPPFATHGSSVTAWERLIEAVRRSPEDYAALFRDAVSLEPVPGWSTLYSLMVQGEDDFHWAVAEDQRADEDPPVHALILDHSDEAFVPVRGRASGAYGCYARVTDFVRGMFEAYDDFIRQGRFLLRGSRAPAKAFLGFTKPLGRRPTAVELGTARHRAVDKLLDLLWDITGIEPSDLKMTQTLGSLSVDEDDWTDLLAILEGEWVVSLDAGVPFEELTIEALSKAMTPADPKPKGAAKRGDVPALRREGALAKIEVRDARGQIRTDLDEDSLLQGIKRADSTLVVGPRNEMVLRWTAGAGATLSYRLSGDGRRYMVTHLDAESVARIAIADGDPRESVAMAVGIDLATFPGHHFVSPPIAAALAERFLLDGSRDPCCEWRLSKMRF